MRAGTYAPKPDDTSLPNVMRQCIQLVSQFPSLAVFGYQASMYFRNDRSMFIQKPDPKLSIAENILYMMRPDGKYTRLEAKLLDLCLVLHAEHGGGNNSAFTVHVVSSSGTDTYSTVAAALGSLKGPKHGGANIKVMEMFEDLKQHCPDWEDEDALREYLKGLLRGEGFDHSGLIYGMGHAVYSVSDPRAVILKSFVEQLSDEKGCHAEYQLYATVERLAKGVRVMRVNEGQKVVAFTRTEAAQDEDDAESLQDGSEQPVVTDEAIPAREAETPSEGITDSSTDESAE